MINILNINSVLKFPKPVVGGAFTVVLFAVTHSTQVKAATDCPIPKYTAPLPATMKPPHAWGQDSGAVLDGYVGLKEYPNVIFGIDLSKHNVIKGYGRYTSCGGKFAFIRLDKAYGLHSKALKAADWTVIPYVYMPIDKSLRTFSQYSKIDSSDIDLINRNYSIFSKQGEDSALTIPVQLKEQGLSTIPSITFAGISGQVIALDAEEKLSDEKSSNKNSQIYYGRFYARAICTWIATARKNYPDLQVIIYTTPSMFGDYLHDVTQQDDDCLRGLPVWMARTTDDGGDLIGVANSKNNMDKYSQHACLQSGGNRCIIHQYSHRGVIGTVLPVTNPSVLHVDLDRAFPVKAVKDAKTIQYVRQ